MISSSSCCFVPVARQHVLVEALGKAKPFPKWPGSKESKKLESYHALRDGRPYFLKVHPLLIVPSYHRAMSSGQGA